jgi:hypothetical protein
MAFVKTYAARADGLQDTISVESTAEGPDDPAVSILPD